MSTQLFTYLLGYDPQDFQTTEITMEEFKRAEQEYLMVQAAMKEGELDINTD